MITFLAKFRENSSIIRKGISFIVREIDQIYTDPVFPLSDDFFNLTAISDDDLAVKIAFYLERKIEVEASFSSFFLGMLIAQYTDAYFQDNKIKNLKILQTYQKCIPNTIKETKGIFVSVLQNGYQRNNIESAIKDEFNNILYKTLISWMSFIENVKDNPHSDVTEKELLDAFEKQNNQNQVLKKIHKYQRRKKNLNEWLAQYYNNSSATPGDFTARFTLALKGKGIQAIQIEYMNWILNKMGKKGAKFSKNDILDMLIAAVLKDDNTILISFDEDMQDFISHNKHISMNYVSKIYVR